jgi:hypothetical protein
VVAVPACLGTLMILETFEKGASAEVVAAARKLRDSIKLVVNSPNAFVFGQDYSKVDAKARTTSDAFVWNACTRNATALGKLVPKDGVKYKPIKGPARVLATVKDIEAIAGNLGAFFDHAPGAFVIAKRGDGFELSKASSSSVNIRVFIFKKAGDSYALASVEDYEP